MSKKNTKSYNKMIMQSGYRAQQRLDEALDLIQEYTTNYADRLDFWSDKLNNRQLDLLQDKYLAQNASMLRNMGAFGSNSQLNQQVNENAYDQQNYLANVQNQNIAVANQLQSNELNALAGSAALNQTERNAGATAASNVDAANNYWLAVLGSSVENAGKIVSSMGGWGAVIGGAMQAGGSAMQNVAGTVQTVGDNSQIQSGDRVNNALVGMSSAYQGLQNQNLSTGSSGGGVTSSLSTNYGGSAISSAVDNSIGIDWGSIWGSGI